MHVNSTASRVEQGVMHPAADCDADGMQQDTETAPRISSTPPNALNNREAQSTGNHSREDHLLPPEDLQTSQHVYRIDSREVLEAIPVDMLQTIMSFMTDIEFARFHEVAELASTRRKKDLEEQY